MPPPTYVLSRLAEKDIDRIVTYIDQDNPAAARMMFDRFYDAFRLLGEHPAVGHYRSDLTDRDVRFWNVKPRYQVIYRESNPLFIMRVLPADMDVARELQQDGSI